MSHNLDTTAGRTSFVSAREDAWHGLGTTLPETFSAEEAMTSGLLGGWDVRKTPLQTVLDNGLVVPVEGRWAVVRNNPVIAGQVDALGTVGDAYRVIQNEQHAALLNALVDESGAHFETAGAIDGGRRVFITMKLPGHIKIGGVDRVDNYIAAVNSHDGSMAFSLMVTPIRIVCQNTLNLAFGSASHMFRLRHTSGAEKALHSQARQALDMTFNYLEGFQEQADQLINASLTQVRFEEIITTAFGAPEDAPKSTVTRTDAKLDRMAELFADAFTQEGVRGTAWAGLNALTEYADHFSATRGQGDAQEASRHSKAIFDPSFKNKALELMLAEV